MNNSDKMSIEALLTGYTTLRSKVMKPYIIWILFITLLSTQAKLAAQAAYSSSQVFSDAQEEIQQLVVAVLLFFTDCGDGRRSLVRIFSRTLLIDIQRGIL